MARKKKGELDPNEIDFSDKKQAVMRLFAQQSPEVRESILRDLPAYNAMLSLDTDSFGELALKVIAKQRGDPYSKSSPPVPDCPYCGKHETVTKKTGYMYRCKPCKRSFEANYNSISSGYSDALLWMKILRCMLDFVSVSETCKRCGIHKNSYYTIRNHLFYGLQLLLDQVKIFGEVQVDNTFVRVSYKGMDLHASDEPEDSVLYEAIFKPRPGRERGGKYLMAERNANSVCIFTGITDRSRVIVRYNGIGMSNLRAMTQYVPTDKFLLEVPKEEPLSDLLKTPNTEPKTFAGDKTIMVADKEVSLENYADHIGVEFESHVYRKNGVQLCQYGGRDIQRVNALHKRLKEFLRRCNYVSTKFLPGYLLLFEMRENFGSNPDDKVIQALFEILATPNLGKPASFYEEMFSVPNYLLEWFEDKNVLNGKLPYNKLLAFYLYDHIRNKAQYLASGSDVKITMEYIEKETGYSAPTIRKFYKDLMVAGYREKILRYFGEPDETEKQSKKTKKAATTFNPIVLTIYDEYSQIRRLPESQRPRFSDFLNEKNEQYGTCFKRTNMLAKFKKIEESGIREPMPEYNKEFDPLKDRRLGVAVKVSKEYDDILMKYREQGDNPPKRDVITEKLAIKYGVSKGSIDQYIPKGRKYRKEHGLG